MANNQQLLDEIEAVLGPTISPSITASSRGSDLFEAYVWCLVICAAGREGAAISYVNTQGSPPVFRFPIGPRSVFSPNPYSYARLRFSGCPELEAHLNIYVAGRSQVRHECDVAVLDRAEASFCRQQNVHPRSSKVLLAVECKFYGATLSLNEARSFLGLTEEIQQASRFLVSNATSGDVSKMLAKHRRGWETGLIPATTRIVERMRGQIETAFKDFQARYA